MSTKCYCDCCAIELKDCKNVIEIPCHIAEKITHGYTEPRTLEPVSGRTVSFDMCARCTNLVFNAAFAEIEKIKSNVDERICNKARNRMGEMFSREDPEANTIVSLAEVRNLWKQVRHVWDLQQQCVNWGIPYEDAFIWLEEGSDKKTRHNICLNAPKWAVDKMLDTLKSLVASLKK